MDPTISVVNGLLSKLETMAKKPALDCSLSEVLDRYLSELDENDKYLANGIFSTNFGEAALLLQSSVDVYVKKVDVLWEKIVEYQKHIITYQKDQDEREVEKLEERRNRYKRKRKVHEDDAQRKTKQTQNDKDKFSSDDIYIMSQSFEIDDEVVTTWRTLGEVDDNFQDSLNSNYTGSDATLFQPVDEIDTQDEDTALKYNHIRTTTVIEEIFNLEDNHLLEDVFQGITRMRIASYVANDYRREMLTCNQRKEGYEDSLDNYILNFMRKRKKDEHSYSALQGLKEGSLPNTPNKKLGRISVSDIQNNQAENNSNVETEAPTLKLQVGEVVTPSRKLGRLSSSDPSNAEPPLLQEEECFVTLKKLPDDFLHARMDNVDVDNVSKPDLQQAPDSCDAMRSASDCDSINECQGNSCDERSAVCTLDETVNIRRSTRVRKAGPLVVCRQLCCMPVANKIPTLSSEDMTVSNQDAGSDSEMQMPKRKMSRRALKKLAVGVTVSFGQFEQFYFHNYQKGDDEEGSVLEIHIITEDENNLSEADTDSVCEDNTAFEDFEPNSYILNTDIENVETNNKTTEVNTLNDSGLGDSFLTSVVNHEGSQLDETVSGAMLDDSRTSQAMELQESAAELTDHSLNQNEQLVSTESVSCQTPEDFEDAAQSHDDSTLDTDATDTHPLSEQEKIDKSVNAWKSFMTPRLKRIGNKSDFDIHAYGSRLMDSMAVNESKHFGSLVDGMSSSEVARYFIATLQLANTHNVEFSGIQPGMLSNDSFTVKVLSKERYHDKLESYQAPSEETFNERLAQAKSMNPKVVLHSTPLAHSSMKQSRHHDRRASYQSLSGETFNRSLAQASSVNSKVVLHSTPFVPSPLKKSRPGKSGRRIIFD